MVIDLPANLANESDGEVKKIVQVEIGKSI